MNIKGWYNAPRVNAPGWLLCGCLVLAAPGHALADEQPPSPVSPQESQRLSMEAFEESMEDIEHGMGDMLRAIGELEPEDLDEILGAYESGYVGMVRPRQNAVDVRVFFDVTDGETWVYVGCDLLRIAQTPDVDLHGFFVISGETDFSALEGDEEFASTDDSCADMDGVDFDAQADFNAALVRGMGLDESDLPFAVVTLNDQSRRVDLRDTPAEIEHKRRFLE
jgi:hypothetical protein